jgi:hypothetical protein
MFRLIAIEGKQIIFQDTELVKVFLRYIIKKKKAEQGEEPAK